MSPWERVLERPHSGAHFVQLHEVNHRALNQNAGHYLWQGLRRGAGVLIIATAERQGVFSEHLERLGAHVQDLIDAGQLVFGDAHRMLSEFMVDGQPEWFRFEKVLRAAMRQVRPVDSPQAMRAYGEMVAILWSARQFAAAIRLEQLWNKLLEQSSFSLYCTYAIDIFEQDCENAHLADVLCAHTHLVPALSDGVLEIAVNRSMDEILGPKAEELRTLIKGSRRPAGTVMPTAENVIFWLRKHLPQQAGEIMGRARDYYRLLSQAAIPALAGD